MLANTEGRRIAPKWAVDGAHVYFSECKNVDFGVDWQMFTARTDGFVK